MKELFRRLAVPDTAMLSLLLTGLLLAGCGTPDAGPRPPAAPSTAGLSPSEHRPGASFPEEIDPLVAEYLALDEVDTDVEKLVGLVVNSFRRELDLVPESFWEEFKAGVDASEMYRSAADLVSQQYSTNELAEIVQFLSSDVGKKFIEGQRELDRKQTHRGAAWVRKLREQLAFELKLKGYM